MTQKMSIRDIIDQQMRTGKSNTGEQYEGNQSIKDHEYPGFEAAEPITLAKPQIDITILEYLNAPLPSTFRERMKKSDGLPTFTGYKTERTDFSDNEYVGRPAINLFQMSDVDCCELGKYVFTKISSSVSRSDIGSILLLAFQLRAPGIGSSARVFPVMADDKFHTNEDVDYYKLETQLTSTNQSEIEPRASGNLLEDAKAYAFLAASMLRMFTRAPENYMKAFGRIQNGYSSFYIDSISVAGVSANEEVLKAIHRQFAIDPIMKSTLFRILYHTNYTDDHESIKNFLYKIHLSYTGMHILPIFVRLCTELRCSSKIVLTLLHGGEYDRQIDALSRLLKFTIDNDAGREKKMWIYGRIFDQNFMSSLQTRNCPRLVYILAAALRKEKPRENAGVLNIVQLQGLSNSDKLRCELAAERLRTLVKRKINAGQDNFVLDVFGKTFVPGALQSVSFDG